MRLLEDITELPTEAAELLDAIGYLEVDEFYNSDTESLARELGKANDKLAIMREAPDAETVRQWKTVCSESEPSTFYEEASQDVESDAEETGAPASGPSIINFEEDPEVIEMLNAAPTAEILPAELIKRNQLPVGDIPVGILLTECDQELDINVLTTERIAKSQSREADAKRTGLVVSRIRNFDQADSGEHHVKPLDKGAAKEVNSVSDGLNAGLNPESRRFVRGVMHPSPLSVRVSAFFAMLVQLLLVVAFVGIPYLFYHEHQSGDSMLWWVVGIAGGLLLSALCYLFWGLSARCRVCGQRQFAPKKCLKNKKAHRIPLIGYIFPTALHALFFKWFYCTYCGTAVRLKK